MACKIQLDGVFKPEGEDILSFVRSIKSSEFESIQKRIEESEEYKTFIQDVFKRVTDTKQKLKDVVAYLKLNPGTYSFWLTLDDKEIEFIASVDTAGKVDITYTKEFTIENASREQEKREEERIKKERIIAEISKWVRAQADTTDESDANAKQFILETMYFSGWEEFTAKTVALVKKPDIENARYLLKKIVGSEEALKSQYGSDEMIDVLANEVVDLLKNKKTNSEIGLANAVANLAEYIENYYSSNKNKIKELIKGINNLTLREEATLINIEYKKPFEKELNSDRQLLDELYNVLTNIRDRGRVSSVKIYPKAVITETAINNRLKTFYNQFVAKPWQIKPKLLNDFIDRFGYLLNYPTDNYNEFLRFFFKVEKTSKDLGRKLTNNEITDIYVNVKKEGSSLLEEDAIKPGDMTLIMQAIALRIMDNMYQRLTDNVDTSLPEIKELIEEYLSEREFLRNLIGDKLDNLQQNVIDFISNISSNVSYVSEISAENRADKHYIQEQPFDSERVRIILASLRRTYQKYTSERPDPGLYETTIFGEKMANVSDIFVKLMNALSKTYDVNSYLNAFTRLAKMYGEIGQLYYKLSFDKGLSDFNFVEWQNFIQFYNTFTRSEVPPAVLVYKVEGYPVLMIGDEYFALQETTKKFLRQIKNSNSFIYTGKGYMLSKDSAKTIERYLAKEEWDKEQAQMFLSELGIQSKLVSNTFSPYVPEKNLDEFVKAARDLAKVLIENKKEIVENFDVRKAWFVPYLNNLAQYEVAVNPETKHVYKDVGGKFRYLFRNPSYHTKLIRVLASVNNKEELFEQYPDFDSDFIRHSAFLNSLFDKDGNVIEENRPMAVFLLGNSNAYGTGLNTEDFSYSDFLVGVTNGLLHDLVSLGILGDSNTQSMVKLPVNSKKIDMLGYLADEVYAAIVDRMGLPKDQVGKLGIFEEILNKNSTVYKDIYNFIKEERKKLPKLTRFGKPESEFTEEEREQQRKEEAYFDEYYATLPTRIYNELKSMEEKIISQINDRVIELAAKDKKELIRAGIFKLQETGKYTIEKLDRERVANVFGIEEAVITEKDLDRIVTWLSKKHLVYTFELHKLFFGDPRVFNKKSISDNLLITTLSKRSKMFATPAEQMFDNKDFNEQMNLLLNNGVGINNEYAWRTDLPEDDPTRIDFSSNFYEATIEEPIANTKDILDSNLPDEIKQAYSEIKEADSFVWISDKFYIQSVLRSGRATEEDLRFFEWQMAATRLALEEDGYYTYASEEQKQRDLEVVSEEEPEGYLDPKKPILVSSNNGIVKIDKSAQYALFYPMIRKFPNLRRLYVLMMRNKVDYLPTEGARKAGVTEVNRIYKPDGTIDESTVLKKSWSSWRDYGIVQRKEYKEDLQHLAIQLAKVVTLNLYKDGVPVSKELDLAYKELVDAIGDLSSRTLTSLKKILGISDDGTVDYNKMAEGLYSIMYKAGLTPEELDRIRKFGELHRVYPLETLSDFGTLVNSIYKYLDKSIIHSSLNGRTLVQIPSTFFEKGNRKIFVKRDGKYIEATKAGEIKEDEKIVITDDNLKFVAKTKDGKTTIRSMEVLVSRKLFEEYIPEGLSDEEAYKYINESTDPNLQRVLRGIAWRIPTQGPNFIVNIKVAGFLDKRMGNIIVVPSGIVTLNNSDFDIDTLNTVFYSNKKPLNTKSTADLETLIYLTRSYIDTAINSRRAGAGILQNVSEKSKVPLIFSLRGIEKTIYRDLRKEKGVSQAQIEDLKRIVRFFGGFEKFATQLIKDKTLVVSRIQTEMLPQIEMTDAGNRMVSAIERLLSAIPDEEYFRKADDYGILEQANEIEKKYENTDLNYFPKDFTTLSYSDVTFLRNVYMWLKNSIGIGALGVTGHAMSQKDSIYIDTNSDFVRDIKEGQGIPLLPFKYNENAAGYPSFSQVYDVDGSRISEILSGLTTLIVDSVNDPSIGKIYPHKRILSVAAMLYRLGVGKATAAFLNQPIIRKMAKELIELKEWRKDSVEQIYKKAYEELKAGVTVNSFGIKKLIDKKYTYNELMQMIDYYSKLKEKPSTDFLLNQELIGRVFVNLIVLSNKFYKVTKAFSIDSNNFNSPFFYKYVDEVIREVEEEGIFKNVRQALEKTHVYKQLAVMKKTEESLKHVFVTERPEVKEMFYRALKHMFEDEYVNADQVNMAYVKISDMFIKYLILHRRPEIKYMLRNLFVGEGRVENRLNTLRKLYTSEELLNGVEGVYFDENETVSSVGFVDEKTTFLDKVAATSEFRRFKEFLNRVPDQFKNLYRELIYLSIVQPSTEGKNIGKYIPLEDRLEIIGDTLSGLLTNGPTQEEIELFEKEFFSRNSWQEVLLRNEKNIPYFRVERDVPYSRVYSPSKRAEFGTDVLFLREKYNDPDDIIHVRRLNLFGGEFYDIEKDTRVTRDMINRMSQLEKDEIYTYKLLRNELGQPVLVESSKRGENDYVYYRVNSLGGPGILENVYGNNESVFGSIFSSQISEPNPLDVLREVTSPRQKPQNRFAPRRILNREKLEQIKQAIREMLTDSELKALSDAKTFATTDAKEQIMAIDTIPDLENNNLLISLVNDLAKMAPEDVAIISNSASFFDSINDLVEEGVWKGYKDLLRDKNFFAKFIIYYGNTAYSVSDTVLKGLYDYVKQNPDKKLIIISPFVGIRSKNEIVNSIKNKVTITKADPSILENEAKALAFLTKLESLGQIRTIAREENISAAVSSLMLPSSRSRWEKILVYSDRESFLKNYTDDILKNNEMTMLVTNTNKRVFELNNSIRNSIFGNSNQPINIGERIVSIMPESKGEIIKVVGVSENLTTYEVNMVSTEDPNKKYNGTLYIQKRTMSTSLKTGKKRETRIILFVPKDKDSAIPTWEEAKEMVEEAIDNGNFYENAKKFTADDYLFPQEEYIRVLYGTYGYAATPYMFDPSTLDNVYIDTGIRYLKETDESAFVSPQFYYNSLLLAKSGNDKKIHLVSKDSQDDTIRKELLTGILQRNYIDNIPINNENRLNCKL